MDEVGGLYEVGRSFTDTYKSCISECGSSTPACQSVCRNVYVGVIPEDCVLQIGCSKSGAIQQECLKNNREKYETCCKNLCAREARPIDCKDYCATSLAIFEDV